MKSVPLTFTDLHSEYTSSEMCDVFFVPTNDRLEGYKKQISVGTQARFVLLLLRYDSVSALAVFTLFLQRYAQRANLRILTRTTDSTSHKRLQDLFSRLPRAKESHQVRCLPGIETPPVFVCPRSETGGRG